MTISGRQASILESLAYLTPAERVSIGMALVGDGLAALVSANSHTAPPRRKSRSATLLGEGLAALATKTTAASASSGKQEVQKSDDGGFSEYVAVPKFLADTGMNKHLIYRLLRTGTLDGFKLDGTRKWVIHRNALALNREKQEER